MTENLPATRSQLDKKLISKIAMDIGKEVVAYCEVMYPQTIACNPESFKISLKNCIYNQVMAAIEISNAEDIERRLEERKIARRRWLAQYRSIRETSIRKTK